MRSSDTGRKPPVRSQLPDYLTTSEVARRLRINQKKVYALLADGRLPASRVSGKWLFPRDLIDRWVADRTVYPPTGLMESLLDRLVVVQGSDDWLLETASEAARERTGIGVASAKIGSLGGLRALADGSAHVAGFHLDDASLLPFLGAGERWYLVELGTREQGLMVRPDLADRVSSPRAAAELGLRLADRQEGSGTHRLARAAFAADGADADTMARIGPFASHLEVALSVLTGAAEVGVGVRLAAEMCRLGFVSLGEETFRLAVRGAYFGHPRFGAFLGALLAEMERAAKRGVAGYRFGSLGRIRPVGGSEEGAGRRRETSV